MLLSSYFFSNFSIIFFWHSLIFLIFTFFPTFLPSSLFHLPTTFYLNITIHFSLHLSLFCLFLFTPSYSPTFLPLLHFHLPTNIYLNITIYFSLHLLLFCLFLFTFSYYKFVIFSSILYIVFPHKNVISLSLSLSIFW